VLRLDRIHAFAFVGNERSVRVMERCGFLHVGPMAHAGHPCVLYALDRPAPS
jgi:RimJ/RimL family protein N-acetyltransferase